MVHVYVFLITLTKCCITYSSVLSEDISSIGHVYRFRCYKCSTPISTKDPYRPAKCPNKKCGALNEVPSEAIQTALEAGLNTEDKMVKVRCEKCGTLLQVKSGVSLFQCTACGHTQSFNG